MSELDAMLDRLRSYVERLEAENDALRRDVARLVRSEGELLDEIHALRDAAKGSTTEGVNQ